MLPPNEPQRVLQPFFQRAWREYRAGAWGRAKLGSGDDMTETIRPEAIPDQPAIRHIHQDAFGGDTEADLVDALRDGGWAEDSLVAEVDGGVVGHILFSRVAIRTRDGLRDALCLAPMAVLGGFQRQGLGTKLVRAGLARRGEQGHEIVLVLGHPEFYRRFGFSAKLARPLRSPFGGGDAWMALELVEGVLAGIEGQVEFSPPFAGLG